MWHATRWAPSQSKSMQFVTMSNRNPMPFSRKPHGGSWPARSGDLSRGDLPDPVGSGPGLDRPVVVVQGDAFNSSRIATTVVIPLTSNQRLAAMPGNVFLSAKKTGLPRDSVANVSQIVAIVCDTISVDIVVASITESVSIKVALTGVRNCGAVVCFICEAISVQISIADVTLPVTIGVCLVRIDYD